MGQDLIGYQTMYPQELTDKEKKELKEYLGRVDSLLKTPNLGKIIEEEQTETPMGTYLKQLNELIPYLPSDLDDEGLTETEDIQFKVGEYLEMIPEALEFLDSLELNGRDVSDRVFTLLGRNYISVFAGDMSYGDEPEGTGYETLKLLDKIGLIDRLEALIPNQSNTEYYMEALDEDSNRKNDGT